MTTDIEFSEREAEFGFRLDGVKYHVRTEVGAGQPTRVVVSETSEHEETQMEPTEDQ